MKDRKQTKKKKNRKVFKSIKHNPLILEFSLQYFRLVKKRKKKQNKNEIKKELKKGRKRWPRNDSISKTKNLFR